MANLDTYPTTHPITTQTAPTFYFIGVTTSKSSSMRVFPRWMVELGRPEVVIQGVDMALHDAPENYRRIVTQMKQDPLSLGGLVTTHKIDLLDAARDLFDELGPYATICDEVSSISKRDGKLIGHATDPVAGGISLDAVIGDGYFGRTGGHVLCFGAGGSAVAMALHLMNKTEASDRPEKLIVVNRSQPRLDKLTALVATQETDIAFEFLLHEDAVRNDAIMADLPAHSVVVNATGMGKDRPGSPITDAGLFPKHGVAWELNYRGELGFMHQALAQRESRQLHVEDGWVYFLHGWTQVIEHVLDLTVDEAQFARLGEIAAAVR
ncbi:MAG: shikimate dehydrogenase [Chloroflexota bacterium]